MKTIQIMFSLLSLFVSLSGKSLTIQPDSNTCLTIIGKITNANEKNAGEKYCTIEIMSNKGQKDTIVLSGQKSFVCHLQQGAYYGIRISKKGFIPRLVSINTLKCDSTEEPHLFKFETTLVRETDMPQLNPEVIDFPIAMISFNEQSKTFVHSEEYTTYIKKEMNTVPLQKPKKINEGSTCAIYEPR